MGVGWQLASRHSLRVATDRCHSAARVQQPEPGSVTWWLLICHHPQTTCSLPCRAMAASDTLQLSLVRQSWASRSLSFDSHHEQRCPRPCHIKPAIPPRGASEVLPLRYQPPEQLCQGIHSAWICLEFCFFMGGRPSSVCPSVPGAHRAAWPAPRAAEAEGVAWREYEPCVCHLCRGAGSQG